MFHFHLTPCRSNHTEGLEGPRWGPQERRPLSTPRSLSPSGWTNAKAPKCNLVDAFFTEWSMKVLETHRPNISTHFLWENYGSRWRQYRLVRMRRVRVRRCRCCWCRVALWTGSAGSHLPVILSAWHLHLCSSLFAPVVDLRDVTSSLRGTKLEHVTLLRLCVSVLLQRVRVMIRNIWRWLIAWIIIATAIIFSSFFLFYSTIIALWALAVDIVYCTAHLHK